VFAPGPSTTEVTERACGEDWQRQPRRAPAGTEEGMGLPAGLRVNTPANCSATGSQVEEVKHVDMEVCNVQTANSIRRLVVCIASVVKTVADPGMTTSHTWVENGFYFTNIFLIHNGRKYMNLNVNSKDYSLLLITVIKQLKYKEINN